VLDISANSDKQLAETGTLNVPQDADGTSYSGHLNERGQNLASLTLWRHDGLKNLPTFLLFLLSQRRGLSDDCLLAIYTWQQGCE